jgi:PadR family transcriptional regulator, regulatory protein PadR
LLTSEWVTDDPRPRKYYRTSDAGDEIASLLLDEWAAMNKSLHHFDKGET